MSDPFPIRAGFIPLLDSAVLLVAAERGFAAAEGLELHLTRETSWANIRDRIAVGHFDVAHMLAPMPIAAALGLTPIAAPIIAPMALGLGGNAITVSTDLWNRMRDAGSPDTLDPRGTGAALRTVIATLRGEGQKLRFGVVHPHSGHNYELRYWLAAAEIDPDRDVEIVIVPPPFLPDALKTGRIDGYCVGEPWNSVAVEAGAGQIVTVKAEIWRSSPEKVLGVSADWAAVHPEQMKALIRALYRAAEWCANPQNHADIANLLADPRHLGQPAAVIMHGLSGQLALGGGATRAVPDFFLPHQRGATFPWQSHALWFYSQMVRWGHVLHTPEHAQAAAAAYRPDLYRAALGAFNLPIPAASSKVEGAMTRATPVGVTKGRMTLGPDGFFDGEIFDPDQLDAYIQRQALKT